MNAGFQPAHVIADLLPVGDTVSIVAFSLDPPAAIVQRLRTLLDTDERARADRFHFEKHRRRFIVGRGVLRHLLGTILGLAPQRVTFAYGPHGKPTVAGAKLPFNLSNSSDLALIALGGGAELGVDVERLRAMDDANAIAQRFFSAPEAAAFEGLAADDRDHGFFRCWTRKEAYIKAIGDGMTMPLDRFQVRFDQGAPCHFVAIGDDPAEAELWQLLHLDPVPGYIGALAVRAPAVKIHARTFDPGLLTETASTWQR